jgi:N-glycosylase/DNA lyase
MDALAMRSNINYFSKVATGNLADALGRGLLLRIRIQRFNNSFAKAQRLRENKELLEKADMEPCFCFLTLFSDSDRALAKVTKALAKAEEKTSVRAIKVCSLAPRTMLYSKIPKMAEIRAKKAEKIKEFFEKKR